MPKNQTPSAELTGNLEAQSYASEHPHIATLSNSPFLVNMSHEINTPLHGVISMLDLLLESGLTSTQREMASIALGSAENLQGLLNNILDFSKIETETLGLHLGAFDLIQQVEAIAKIYTAAADKKKLQIIVNYPATVRRLVIGDSARIGQVITNMLSNAIKFTDTGQVVMDLHITVKSDDQCHLRVSVTDTGGGLPSAFINDIFHKIIPGDASTTRQHSGAGLGLVISKQLIDLMGGQIGVENDIGHGCMFWFSLDLTLIPNALNGIRVLFVEAQDQNRHATEQHLSQQGMRAEGFVTANAALDNLERAVTAQDPYRIAILDQQMPGIDGETLGLALKMDPAYKDIQLILLSTMSRASDAQRFAQAGFSAVLRKPVAPQILLDTLATLGTAIQNGKPAPFLAYSTTSMLGEKEDFFPNARVLVVDDSLVNQMVAVRMLEKLGCRTDAASSGKSALAMLSVNDYDLILMDCQMPELDGYQTTTMIRAKEAGQRHTPIIGWTAYTVQDGKDKCLAAGMDDIMSKPIRPQVLLNILSRWLRQIATSEALTNMTSPSDELDSMKEMFGNDFAELAGLFRTDSPQRISALNQAATDGDAIKVAKIAHALSGSSASIGATEMAALCKELEINTKLGIPSNIWARLAAIETAYSTIDNRLQKMM